MEIESLAEVLERLDGFTVDPRIPVDLWALVEGASPADVNKSNALPSEAEDLSDAQIEASTLGEVVCRLNGLTLDYRKGLEDIREAIRRYAAWLEFVRRLDMEQTQPRERLEPPGINGGRT